MPILKSTSSLNMYIWIMDMKTKTCFIRRISVANAIQTKDNELRQLIIYCLNCIRCD